VSSPEVVVQNGGTGSVLLSWAGGPDGGVLVGPNQQLVVQGAADNFTATLETSGATYELATNAGFQLIQAGEGVTGVTLSVSTELYGQASGDGHRRHVGAGDGGRRRRRDRPAGGKPVELAGPRRPGQPRRRGRERGHD
jgi:hypothetical protein